MILVEKEYALGHDFRKYKQIETSNRASVAMNSITYWKTSFPNTCEWEINF
jgi:hypothetical protein